MKLYKIKHFILSILINKVFYFLGTFEDFFNTIYLYSHILTDIN